MYLTFLILFVAVLGLSIDNLHVNADVHDFLMKEGPDDVSNVVVRKRGLKQMDKKKKQPPQSNQPTKQPTRKSGFDCSSCINGLEYDCSCISLNFCCLEAASFCPGCNPGR
ncbi:hypothetical protein MHU86_1400 [Fragilaria crotonensis]|nr:hypothetical protein MHU86_1400 [Fragilaria crotonensis]